MNIYKKRELIKKWTGKRTFSRHTKLEISPMLEAYFTIAKKFRDYIYLVTNMVSIEEVPKEIIQLQIRTTFIAQNVHYRDAEKELEIWMDLLWKITRVAPDLGFKSLAHTCHKLFKGAKEKQPFHELEAVNKILNEYNRSPKKYKKYKKVN